MVSKSVCKLIAVEKRLKGYSVLQQDSMMTFAWNSLVLGVSPVMPLGPWGEERRKKINARNEFAPGCLEEVLIVWPKTVYEC